MRIGISLIVTIKVYYDVTVFKKEQKNNTIYLQTDNCVCSLLYRRGPWQRLGITTRNIILYV